VGRFETGARIDASPVVHTLKPRSGAPAPLVRERARIVAFAGGGVAAAGAPREDGWEEF
jgi:methyl-accepting chemotaxis protein